MVNRNLIRGLDLNEQDWEQELTAALEGTDPEQIEWGGGGAFSLNEIVQGRVLRIEGDQVLVDVGYKSEGMIPLNEWDEDEEPPQPGQTIEVLIEDIEDIQAGLDEASMVSLSKRKAEKIKAWRDVMASVHENDVVTGVATRKIKGGLLVDIG
ncbi:MAG: hypothetical protein B7Z73_10820, partial [Planctomycetia bacterium 21-64-5]